MVNPALPADYPPPHRHDRVAGAGAIVLHLLLVAFAAWLTWMFQIKSLRELMAQGGVIAQSGPAPEQYVEIQLQTEEPPPPTDNPEFVREVVKPKPVAVVPPKVVTKPTPSPVKPKFTAVGATGQGESAGSSRLVVGSSGFPHPTYPFAAKKAHQTGTVTIAIQFDGSGQASSVEITQSSGVHILDTTTRTFVQSNWHNPQFAGRRVSVPVEYQLN